MNMALGTLLDLGLESGQTCYIWRVGDTFDSKREATAWLAAEKNLSRKVVQLSKAFQEACGFKLVDELNICSAGGAFPRIAENVLLRDVTAEEDDAVSELTETERPHWEWYVGHQLSMYLYLKIYLSICIDPFRSCQTCLHWNDIQEFITRWP